MKLYHSGPALGFTDRGATVITIEPGTRAHEQLVHQIKQGFGSGRLTIRMLFSLLCVQTGYISFISNNGATYGSRRYF